MIELRTLGALELRGCDPQRVAALVSQPKPLGLLKQGRIVAGLGERRKARDSYQFVVDVWRHADPELEPYIREARAGLQRLAAE
jgi:hypothetical protein